MKLDLNYINLTEFPYSHLQNRLKYFERILEDEPNKMTYMGKILTIKDIKIHIKNIKKEIKERG